MDNLTIFVFENVNQAQALIDEVYEKHNITFSSVENLEYFNEQYNIGINYISNFKNPIRDVEKHIINNNTINKTRLGDFLVKLEDAIFNENIDKINIHTYLKESKVTNVLDENLSRDLENLNVNNALKEITDKLNVTNKLVTKKKVNL